MSEMAFVAMYNLSDTRHDGFLQNLNRRGISFLSNEFSCLLSDPYEDFCPSPSVCFAFEWDAGEDDRPFSSLTLSSVSRS